MRRSLLVCILFARLLADNVTCPVPPASIAVEPLGLINGCVDVVTGHYIASTVEVTVDCAEPVTLYRHLMSCENSGKSHSFWRIGKEYLDFRAPREDRDRICAFTLVGMAGETVPFIAVDEGKEWKFRCGQGWELEVPKDALICNTSYGPISGATNPRNYRIAYDGRERFTLTKGDGEQRIYTHGARTGWCGYRNWKDGRNQERKQETFLLREIIRPSGNRIFFTYDEQDRLTKIHSTNSTGKGSLGHITIAHEEDRGRQEKIIETSDSRTIKYQLKKHGKGKKQTTALAKITSPGDCEESFSYHGKSQGKNRFALTEHAFPGHIRLETDYYAPSMQEGSGWRDANPRVGRVSEQRVPIGKNGEYAPIYKLHYGYIHLYDKGHHSFFDQQHTRVADAEGEVIEYQKGANGLLYRILRQDAQGNLISRTSQGWREGNLCYRRVSLDDPAFDRGCHYLRSQEFEYDDRGNITRRLLYGNLTGAQTTYFDRPLRPSKPMPTDVHETLYTYSDDGLNLLLSEDNGRRQIRHDYVKGTSLLSSSTTFVDGLLREKISYVYDHNAALIRTERQAGWTSIQEIIRRSREGEDGLPTEIIESYLEAAEEHLLKRTVLTYDDKVRVTKREVYDANNDPSHTLFTEYDERSRVVSQTDALGQETRFVYDDRDNVVDTWVEGSKRWVHCEYDAMNRLIKRTTQDRVEENQNIEKFTWDKMSRQCAIVDPLGGTTDYRRDNHGRILEEQLPAIRSDMGWHVPSVNRQYDALDRVIEESDPSGFVTNIKHTARNQWCQKDYPDGTSESRRFSLDGFVEREIHRDGSETRYSRDYRGRILTKQRVDQNESIVSEESYVYSGDLLLSRTDARGFKTTYEYDGAGRLTCEKRHKAVTKYEYDSLGRRTVEKKWADASRFILTRTEYDLLDRVTAIQTEDEKGRVYRRVETDYDTDGNVIAKRSLLSESRTTFDGLGRPISKIDPLGQETLVSYERTWFEGHPVLLITTTEPNGRRTLEYRDSSDRPLQTQTRSPPESNKLLAQVDYYYDYSGNEVEQRHLVIIDGQEHATYAFGKEWGPCDRLEEAYDGLTAVPARATSYEYDKSGRLCETIKPDGTHVYRSYDGISRLKTLAGPDFSYTYTYDATDNVIQVADVQREYDPHGRLSSESTPAGTITYQRDWLGRKTSVSYLDQEISYSYRGPYLHKVSWKDLVHEYTKYDLEGRPLKEKLPGSCGFREREYDALGRLTKLTIPFFSQDEFKYDEASNLTHLATHCYFGEWDESFTYDDLDQLLSEPDTLYSHDSIGNRLSENNQDFTYDAYNQRTTDHYDPCGCLTQVGPHTCSYDGLDRLTQLDNTPFTYDAYHRRTDLLHDGQIELGTPSALRILGHQPQADIGAMVFYILDGEPFIPIMDHMGSINLLVDPDGTPCEHYHYSAFGVPTEQSVYDNPWRFCSKRQEGDLLFFGRRYYHPPTGRWLTPDPLGHPDGPNLYTYCHNNPLTLIDPYGLFFRTLAVPSYSIPSAKQLETHAQFARGVRDFAPPAFSATLQLPWNALKALNTGFWHPYATGRSAIHSLRDDGRFFRSHSFGESFDYIFPFASQLRHSTPEERPYLIGGAFGGFIGGTAGGLTLGMAGATISSLAFPTSALTTSIRSHPARSASRSTDPGLTSPNRRIWTQTRSDSSATNAYRHWQRHRHEFLDLPNAQSYVREAHRLTHPATANALKKVRPNGDILYYYTDQNIFIAMDKHMTPRTMFKPQDGINYWWEQ